MDRGAIWLHRKIKNNPIYQKGDYFRIWIHILLNVNFEKGHSFIWNNKRIELKQGEGIFSQLKISQELKISLGSVNRILKYLENENQIGKQTTPGYTLLSVVKWEDYQNCGKPIGKQRESNVKANGKQRETLENEEKNKNEKNISKDIGEPSSLEIEEQLEYIPLEEEVKKKKKVSQKKKIKKYKNFPFSEPTYQETNELIDMFNMGRLNDWMKNDRTERNAISYLFRRIGHEKLKQTIKKSLEIQGEDFAPTITKPSELKLKINKVISYYAKQTTEQSKPQKGGVLVVE